MKSSLLSKKSLETPFPIEEKIATDAPHKRVIILSGPTAVGKTDLSLSIAAAIGGEIISADSCQVYRKMDIGTAKVSAEQRALITHHMIDIREIQDPFNVAQFAEQATRTIAEILARGNVPIIVGGSGFYIHVLLHGPPQGPPSDRKVRAQIEMQLKNLGREALYEKLQQLDPEYAATISERDQHKIVRALEIMTLSEQKVSSFPKPKSNLTQNYDFRCWFLYYPRDLLYAKIEKRCDEMIEKGLLDEVRELERQQLRENSSAANAIGYRQALEYLDSLEREEDYETFVRRFKKATRHFAKRQFTWFRKEPLFRWLDVSAFPQERLKEMILQDYEQGYPNI